MPAPPLAGVALGPNHPTLGLERGKYRYLRRLLAVIGSRADPALTQNPATSKNGRFQRKIRHLWLWNFNDATLRFRTIDRAIDPVSITIGPRQCTSDFLWRSCSALHSAVVPPMGQHHAGSTAGRRRADGRWGLRRRRRKPSRRHLRPRPATGPARCRLSARAVKPPPTSSAAAIASAPATASPSRCWASPISMASTSSTAPARSRSRSSMISRSAVSPPRQSRP